MWDYRLDYDKKKEKRTNSYDMSVDHVGSTEHFVVKSCVTNEKKRSKQIKKHSPC